MEQKFPPSIVAASDASARNTTDRGLVAEGLPSLALHEVMELLLPAQQRGQHQPQAMPSPPLTHPISNDDQIDKTTTTGARTY